MGSTNPASYHLARLSFLFTLSFTSVTLSPVLVMLSILGRIPATVRESCDHSQDIEDHVLTPT